MTPTDWRDSTGRPPAPIHSSWLRWFHVSIDRPVHVLNLGQRAPHAPHFR